MLGIHIFLIILLFSFSLEDCHSNCKKCYDLSLDNEDMKCLTCLDGLYFIFNTSNCVNRIYYVNYYLNETDNKLYPCSFFEDSNCYECNPNSNSKGICLSCNRGYKYNNDTKECLKCEENEYPIIINDFDGCQGKFENTYCNKYVTHCQPLENEEIICSDEAPIFDNLTQSCNEFECQNSGLEEGICYPVKKKFIDRILFINWFDNEPKYVRFPNFYFGNSLLLLELTCEVVFMRTRILISKTNQRRFYFYNEEGRGLFDEINDNYEKLVKFDKKHTRFFSSAISLKSIDSEKFRYFLNLESFNYNLELLDVKTGEYSYDNIFEIFELTQFIRVDYLKSFIQMMKLKEENHFLICLYVQQYKNNLYNLRLSHLIIQLNATKEEKINIYSLDLVKYYHFNFNFNEKAKFYIIQTKKGDLWTSVYVNGYTLILIHEVILGVAENYFEIFKSSTELFHKLLFIKDEIFLLCNVVNPYTNRILIFEYREDKKLYTLLNYLINLENKEGNMPSDIIVLTETKVAYVTLKFHGRRISIYILNFFDNYKYVAMNMFHLNIYEETVDYNLRFSFLFKYKDLLGLNLENIEGRNGFILFGYFNSTDPKQIYNIKKDGLNYEINLGSYLTLQSNAFEYEKKCIKIVEVPSINESGIYLISNITKNIIRKNECIDLNTKISLNFAYNGIIKKGNYLFKFCGVLEEATFEKISEYSDKISWNTGGEELNEEYIKIYNERRSKNIAGKVALVQINVLNDTKVFCDDKYKDTAIISTEGQYITCGEGKFYDIENDNEITQINLGDDYYFDINKNVYIKCHELCKSCSKAYNYTNMNCDECYENYFLRDGICLEISECEYNYYYDNNLKLICINKENYCPDFKPFENKNTKECIEKCDIIDLNNSICGPTNNPISINETEKLLLNNANYLNLEEKLIQKEENYIISGNNISFIFSTSNIEKKELYDNFNGSSIILNECENIIKNKYFTYFINGKVPIPILKIEKYNKNFSNIDVNYELLNPNDLTNKLDLDLCQNNYVEVRLPLILKKYKMDLVLKTSNLGYNIFDLNDPFFHDICSVFTYNDSDFSLSERKNLLDLTDENLCMPGCNFSNFDIKTLRTICHCKIGQDFNITSLIPEIQIGNFYNKDNKIINILDENLGFEKASNIKVVKCFSIIFNKKLFTENYGFFIMLCMTILNIILIIFSPIYKLEKQLKIFCCKVLFQMKTIYFKIQEESKSNLLINKDGEDSFKNKNEISTETILDQKGEINFGFNKDYNEKQNFKANSFITEEKSRNSILASTSKSKLNKNYKSFDYLKNDYRTEDIKLNKKEDKLQKIVKELTNKNNSEYYVFYVIKFIPNKKRRNYLTEIEIENLSYKDALKIENRNKSEYYFSLLLEKNRLISMFLNDKDYNISTIKIILFIFNFNLQLTINALFFNDQAIYEINQDEGSFNLGTQIRRIVYSAIISILLSIVVELLALTHKNIIKLRYYKKIKEAEDNIPQLLQKLKIKIIIFFGIIIFFDIIFFYYITAFCAIYSIIQIHLISDSLMSFLLTTSYSIILSLISSIMRIFSLQKENKSRYFLYLISWVISLL